MDFNSLIESGEAVWAMIGTMGAATVLSTLTFIKTMVSAKKFTKLSDFAVIADQSMKFAKKEIIDMRNAVVTEVKSDIVEPLKEQVLSLKEDNANLASLSVTLLSYVQVPLDVKKEALAAITKLGNVSNEAKKMLESSTQYQETKEQETKQENENLENNIEDI